MKIGINKEICQRCGLCSCLDPSVFQEDESTGGIPDIYNQFISDDESIYKEAVNECPSGALFFLSKNHKEAQ